MPSPVLEGTENVHKAQMAKPDHFVGVSAVSMVAKDVCQRALGLPVKWTFLEEQETQEHFVVFVFVFKPVAGIWALGMLLTCVANAEYAHSFSPCGFQDCKVLK